MADNDDDDDFYNDPATIGDTTDEVSGEPDNLPPRDDEDPSESIYTPEKNTTDLDDRGDIDELEASDASDFDELADEDPTVDKALLDAGPDLDTDDYKLGDVDPKDEDDGTEE
jgi:hypothetical protein